MDFSNRPASIDQGGHSSVKVGDDLRSLFPQTSNQVEPGTKGGVKDSRSFALRFVINMEPSDEKKTYYNCTNRIVPRAEWAQALHQAKTAKPVTSTTTTSTTTTSPSPSSSETTSSPSASSNPEDKDKDKKKKKKKARKPAQSGQVVPDKDVADQVTINTGTEDWINRFLPDDVMSKLPLPEEIVALIMAVRARWTVPMDCNLKVTVIMGFRTSHVFIPRLPMEESSPKYGGRIVLNLRHKDVYYMLMDGDIRDTEALRVKPNKCFMLNPGEGIMLPPGLCSMTDIWLSSNTKYTGPPSNVVGDRTGKAVPGLRTNNYDRITVIIDLPLSDLLIHKITSEFGDSGGEPSASGSGSSPLNNIMNNPKLKGMANSAGIKKKINKDPTIQNAIESAVRGIKAMAPAEIETEAVSTQDTIDFGLRVIGGKQSLQDAVQAASSKVPEVPVSLAMTEQASVASQMSSILGTDGSDTTKTAADVLDQLSSILSATAAIPESTTSEHTTGENQPK